MRQYFLFIVFVFMSATAFSQSSAHNAYTYDAIDHKVQGKLFISFIVDPKGKIVKDSVKVLRGLGYGLDEVAIDLIKNAPDWTGNGKIEKYTIPVTFLFENITDKEWSEYYTTKGGKLMEQSKWDDAIDSYNEAIIRNKKNATAYYGLSKAYEGKGDTVNAKLYLDKAYKKGYKV